MTALDRGTESHPLWQPSPEEVSRTRIHRFAQLLREDGEVDAISRPGALDYEVLHGWSVAHPERFWPALWRFTGVIAGGDESRGSQWSEVVRGLERMAPPDEMLGPRWFVGARLNFAENLLRHRDDGEAIVSWNEHGRRAVLTHAQLYDAVARTAAALRASGIAAGDRVAAVLPNIPEAVIAMLATASLGAIWSSCSPDFGVTGVLDRFGQIRPRLLFAADGYRYGAKEIDSLERVRDIAAQLPDIERVVVVPYLRREVSLDGIREAVLWDSWLREEGRGKREASTVHPRHVAAPVAGEAGTIEFVRLPFDHPLCIMYSSGTTGLPKCMVHGAGGTLLQHLKEHVLHTDLSRDDRIFYFTTCGWMMWNWLVSALAVGATIVLYDGAPMTRAIRPGHGELSRGPDILWQLAEDERITVFGTSAKYLALAEKDGMHPGRTRDLSALRSVLSTGSPLSPPSFDWVYSSVKGDVRLSSISGGTDIISCFALGNPAGPVWRGELQAAGLGMKVAVFDELGQPVFGEPGELVCTMPFPSMPVAFWNDPDGSRYRAAYFDVYPGVWRHGDWAELTVHGGMIITGRSDATLNPGGVRIGTAEIYRQVEQLPEILESLVVGQDIVLAPDRDVRIVLFVRLREGLTLDAALRERIKRQIRDHTSPHHVPKVIVQVADIPRTISGKITELAVREVIHGRTVKNADALANPESLQLYRDLPELAQ